MQLTKQRLIDDTMALGRCLTVISPDYPNRVLALEAELRRIGMEGRQRDGQWFKLSYGKDKGYVLFKSDGSAIYRRQLREGRASAELITIEVDIKDAPGLMLLDELSALLDGLNEGRLLRVAGTGEVIEACGEGFADETLTGLRAYVELVRRAVSPRYNEEVTSGMLSRLRDIALLDVPDTKGAMINRLVEIADEVARLRSILGADGYLASFFLIFRDVCLEVGGDDDNSVSGGKSAATQLFNYFGMCSAGIINDPKTLSMMLIDKLALNGRQEVAGRIAHSYLKRGEDLVDKALSSNTLDGFGGSLYTAGLYYLSALQVFKGLANASSVHGAMRESIEYQRAAGHADERVVRIGTSFINAVQNRTGEKLRKHQAMVEAARCKGGDAAAQQQIFEFIEMGYYYPRHYEKKLQGEAALPERYDR